MFRKYARSIHSRALPSDPNFLRLSVACGKIEQWCEHHYPSFVSIGKQTGKQSYKTDDARSLIVLAEEKEKKAMPLDQSAANARAYNSAETSWEMLAWLIGAFLALTALCFAIVFIVIYYFKDMDL